MSIHVTDKEPDVYVSADELARYTAEYQRAYMFYAGTPPSLEAFIRRKQRENAEQRSEYIP